MPAWPRCAPEEWCGEMRRAAALALLSHWKTVLAQGLTLPSARASDTQFAGTRPVYTRDAIPFSRRSFRRAAQQFDSEFLALVLLVAGGRGNLVQNKRDATALAESGADPKAVDLPPARYLAERLRELESISIPNVDTCWTGYDRLDAPLDDRAQWTPKQIMVAESLKIARPRTVLDLGANTGWYSRLAAVGGARVTAIDADEHCIDRLYRRADREGAEILPLVLNLAIPTPARSSGRRFPSSLDRFSAEMVIATALSHHLILSNLAWDFGRIAAYLSHVAAKYLLTEFVSFAAESFNPYGRGDRPGCETWYNIDGFAAALSVYFKEIVPLPSWPPGRKLLFCER